MTMRTSAECSNLRAVGMAATLCFRVSKVSRVRPAMRMSVILIAIFSLVFVMMPTNSGAVSLNAGACLTGKTDLGPYLQVCSGPPGGGGSIFTGATGVGAGVSYGSPAPNFLQLSAGATQDFGISRARVSLLATESAPGPGEGYGGNTIGDFQDTWTIMPPSALSPLLLGKPGSFKLSYTVTGAVSPFVSLPNASAGFVVLAFLDDGTNTSIHVTPPAGPIVSGVFTSSSALPMIFGVPFDLDVQTLLSASFGLSSGDRSAVSGAFAADFSATATLTAVQAFDQFGNPVQGIGITAASRTVFPLIPAEPQPAPGPTVPEPGTLALVASGAIALALGRRWGSSMSASEPVMKHSSPITVVLLLLPALCAATGETASLSHEHTENHR